MTEALTYPPIALEDEMRQSYLDYAMSVIVSRALPDVRDGLKPVHRRIFYAMRQGGYTPDKAYKKSARIVGDVMGQYHPHGDQAIYDALVRLAQDFSMRLPLIDGQGNFGSMDGDPPAQMRYTEARLGKPAMALLEDIDKGTVDFRPNYDESTTEPEVLPARIPNLLVNGAGGIAVGMATNIPPHNLGEVVDACCALLDDPETPDAVLTQIIPGPDFPTGAQILGRSGIRAAYATGNGSVTMRATTHTETIGRREAIIVDAVPYQVNKARLLERLGEVGREKIVDDIAAVRDESDRDGVRVVVEIKPGANADVILNQLYKFTALQTNFSCNMVALDHGRPRTMTLREMLVAFVAFRRDVVRRRTAFELAKARERAHVLAGLAVAVANIDDVIALIRAAGSPAEAREGLMARAWPTGDVAPLIALIDDPAHPLLSCPPPGTGAPLHSPPPGTGGGQGGVLSGPASGDPPLTPPLQGGEFWYRLSEAQAKAILDLRLHRLTGLERDKIGDELRAITDEIARCLAILASAEKLTEVVRAELAEVKERFATPRLTEIVDAEFEVDIESLIQREDMVVTITHGGYIKRVPLDAYRAQRRGGKGRSATNLKDEDFVADLFVASTHTPILFFTSRGIVHRMKVYQLPLATPQGRGKALINLLPLEAGERVQAYMRLPEDEGAWADLDVMFATSHGTVRRNALSDFANIRANGLIAMKLGEGESLVAVRICREGEDVLLATRAGKAIRFAVGDVRRFAGRTSTGVRGIRLAEGDEVISASILRGTPGEMILTVSQGGFGKRTDAGEFRCAGRRGQGVAAMTLTDKTGAALAAAFPVADGHQIMLVTDAGQMIRTPVADIRVTGRAAQGVTLFRLAEGERVVSVAWLAEEADEEEEPPVTQAERAP
jgi:DNA gyrase subunit A